MQIQSRDALRQQWLEQHLQKMSVENFNIHALPGDASFRRYFRITTEKQNFLMMDAPPELEDSFSFITIAKAYHSHGIHTPKIYAENLQDGFFLIEDFGDQLLNPALNTETANHLYRKCYSIIPEIQQRRVIPGWKLPNFTDSLLMTELKNFYEWVLIKFAELTLTSEEENLLQITFELLLKNAVEQPQVGVHRDYHSRNLMLLDNEKIGVIDFQDAVIGPITYDLVSLLRDCYIDWPVEQVYCWVEDYYQHFANKHEYTLEQFTKWFDLQGLQRHLKAIFIFCRKYLRDGSTNYLNDIPRTLNYLKYVCAKYPELKSFEAFILDRLEMPLTQKIQKILLP